MRGAQPCTTGDGCRWLATLHPARVCTPRSQACQPPTLARGPAPLTRDALQIMLAMQAPSEGVMMVLPVSRPSPVIITSTAAL
jgi:hypothetical protein